MPEYTVGVTFYVTAETDQAAWDEVERAVLTTNLVAKLDENARPAKPNPEAADPGEQ